MERLKILFWKTISLFWNFEPRLHLPKYSNEPILSTEIADSYTYPENCLILYEWDEKGKHWMVFSRSKNFFYSSSIRNNMEIKYSNTIPEIYPTLKEKFGISWDKGIIITYGNTIYCKFKITPDLEIHEATHVKQQIGYGVKEWWARYLEDVEFRLSQELEAYKNQTTWAKENYLRNERKALIQKCAIDLASS